MYTVQSLRFKNKNKKLSAYKILKLEIFLTLDLKCLITIHLLNK